MLFVLVGNGKCTQLSIPRSGGRGGFYAGLVGPQLPHLAELRLHPLKPTDGRRNSNGEGEGGQHRVAVSLDPGSHLMAVTAAAMA